MDGPVQCETVAVIASCDTRSSKYFVKICLKVQKSVGEGVISTNAYMRVLLQQTLRWIV